ncbi:MAG: hypothetical protein ACFE0O_06115 [Opitutales bacterium]
MSWKTAKQEAERLAGSGSLPEDIRGKLYLRDDVAALVPEKDYSPAFRAMVIRAMKRIISRRGGRID